MVPVMCREKASLVEQRQETAALGELRLETVLAVLVVDHATERADAVAAFLEEAGAVLLVMAVLVVAVGSSVDF